MRDITGIMFMVTEFSVVIECGLKVQTGSTDYRNNRICEKK